MHDFTPILLEAAFYEAVPADRVATLILTSRGRYTPKFARPIARDDGSRPSGVGAAREKLTAPRRFDYGQMSTKPMPA